MNIHSNINDHDDGGGNEYHTNYDAQDKER